MIMKSFLKKYTVTFLCTLSAACDYNLQVRRCAVLRMGGHINRFRENSVVMVIDTKENSTQAVR